MDPASSGYDHEIDDGEMAAKEHRLRKVLRLPVTLTKNNGTSAFL